MFAQEVETEAIRRSQVWLRHIEFIRGAVYSIDAASGRGKSSLCAFIYGLRRDFLGTVTLGARDVRTLDIKALCDIRRHNLAWLPQGLDLFPELSALDNVLIKNRLTGHCSRPQIDGMFERLGIADRRDCPAGQLSIGQQQRVALIRALCQPFDFILLDEPVSHLDAENNRLCATLVREVADAQGAGIIATSVGNPLALTGQVNTLSL